MRWLLLLIVCACNLGLDEITLVEDLRVLAIKAEPPEVLDDFDASAVANGTLPVRFEALVVDPRDGALTYNWSFCAVQSDNGCFDRDDLIEAAYDQIDETLSSLPPESPGAFMFGYLAGLIPSSKIRRDCAYRRHPAGVA